MEENVGFKTSGFFVLQPAIKSKSTITEAYRMIDNLQVLPFWMLFKGYIVNGFLKTFVWVKAGRRSFLSPETNLPFKSLGIKRVKGYYKLEG